MHGLSSSLHPSSVGFIVHTRLPGRVLYTPRPARWCRPAVSCPAMASFAFTPLESAIGGLSLGILAFSRLALSGRVLGISGIVKGVLDGQNEAWRTAFVTGLLTGGMLLTVLLPSAFQAFPSTYTLSRAIFAGLLVGVGTAMGNGCTSGHGICGISRLSVRSLVATLGFMTSGMLTAYLANTAAVFRLPAGIAPLVVTPTPAFRLGTVVLACAVFVQSGLMGVARRVASRASSRIHLASAAGKLEVTPLIAEPPAEPDTAEQLATVSVVSDLFIGILFATGLGVSGMLEPSKVAGFLAVLSGTWDPSLMAVMGGALLFSLPATLLGLKQLKSPFCAPGFSLPTRADIDWRLVCGSLLFGAGWGLGGICPGPALVGLASMQAKSFAFVAAMLAGMKLNSLLFSK